MRNYMTVMDMADLLYIDHAGDRLEELMGNGVDEIGVYNYISHIEAIILKKSSIYDRSKDIETQLLGQTWYNKNLTPEQKAVIMAGIDVNGISLNEKTLSQKTDASFTYEDWIHIADISEAAYKLMHLGRSLFGESVSMDFKHPVENGTILADICHFTGIIERHSQPWIKKGTREEFLHIVWDRKLSSKEKIDILYTV